VQNVLVQLLQRLQRFELDHTRGRFRTFLWQVTNYAVIDWLRRQKGQAAAEQRSVAELSAFEDAAARAPDADWVDEERKRIVAYAIDQARIEAQPRSWQCFELHILQGTAAANVATSLGLTTNAVYVNASRILARVRAKCLEYDEGLSDE
jgi:RNA polymerase sigma factor (sigma-70 family)